MGTTALTQWYVGASGIAVVCIILHPMKLPLVGLKESLHYEQFGKT